MNTLNQPLRDAIRFETNYAHHFESLMRINPARFRGLGDQHCRAFVAHAAEKGDDLRLYTLGSVAYLMFLMHWLGSHFLDDPRHAELADIFTSSAAEEERIDEARAAFIVIAEQHIGHRGEIFLNRLTQLPAFESYVTDTSKSHHKLHDALLDTWQIQGTARSDHPREALENEAVASAKALGIDTPLGRRICLVLTFILGARFHADPLYPWVRDKTQQAKEDGKPPDQALLDYSKKRMAAMLRKAED